jgi:uncharacterized membrane protein
MRRPGLRLLLLVVLALGVAAPAGAQTAPPLDVRIERDLSPRTSINQLGVPHRVTLIDKATGQPPAAGFEVFGQAANDRGGEQTPAFECEEMSLSDAKIPPRVYYCPIIVDHGGSFVFTAIVNKARASQKDTPVNVAKASAPFQLDTNEVYTGDPTKKVIRGKFAEVFALSGHAFSGAVWFGCVMALAALVFPAFRRCLSPGAIYRLERRLDLVVKLTWAATGVVVASGTYLLVNQTAYKTPFSKSAIDGVFALPFGRPYFLVLAAKLAIYAVMVAASIPLVAGAQRNLRLHTATPPAPRVARATAAGGVVTAVEVETQTAGPPRERSATLLARVATYVVVVGLPAILICVTLLKYFHELVEASRVISGT